MSLKAWLHHLEIVCWSNAQNLIVEVGVWWGGRGVPEGWAGEDLGISQIGHCPSIPSSIMKLWFSQWREEASQPGKQHLLWLLLFSAHAMSHPRFAPFKQKQSY